MKLTAILSAVFAILLSVTPALAMQEVTPAPPADGPTAQQEKAQEKAAKEQKKADKLERKAAKTKKGKKAAKAEKKAQKAQAQAANPQ